jgi:putative tryptophan/tyrosine transport system substrate-binding protein
VDRRTFLSLASGVLAVPLGAEAEQPGKVHQVGLLLTSPDGEPGFLAALRNLGYVEGQNVSIERRYMADRKEGLPVLARELVQLNPDIIVVVNGYQAAAVRESTKTVPIVTMAAGDLVAEGLVANLAKPGRNITGSQVMRPDTAAKRVALLKETIPSISRIALLFGPVGQWFYDSGHRRHVADLGMQYRLPTMCDARPWTDAGNFMSYGADVLVLIERAALFVDKILKGAKPGDLPIEQPTKFELVMNLRTAKGLGLTIPRSLLLRADQVIE